MQPGSVIAISRSTRAAASRPHGDHHDATRPMWDEGRPFLCHQHAGAVPRSAQALTAAMLPYLTHCWTPAGAPTCLAGAINVEKAALSSIPALRG